MQEVWFSGVVGSGCYCAPEMFSLQKYRGKPADMFAIGVSLFILVIGCLPFDKADELNDNLFRLLQLDDTYAYWKEHSTQHNYAGKLAKPTFRKLIKALLTKDLAKRLSIEEFLEHPWMRQKYGSDEEAKIELLNRRK